LRRTRLRVHPAEGKRVFRVDGRDQRRPRERPDSRRWRRAGRSTFWLEGPALPWLRSPAWWAATIPSPFPTGSVARRDLMPWHSSDRRTAEAVWVSSNWSA